MPNDVAHDDWTNGSVPVDSEGWTECSDVTSDSEDEPERDEPSLEATPRASIAPLPVQRRPPPTLLLPTELDEDKEEMRLSSDTRSSILMGPNALGLLNPPPSPFSSFPSPPTARPTMRRAVSAKAAVGWAVANIKTRLSPRAATFYKEDTQLPSTAQEQQKRERRAGVRSMPPGALEVSFTIPFEKPSETPHIQPRTSSLLPWSPGAMSPTDFAVELKRRRSATVLNTSSETRMTCCGRLLSTERALDGQDGGLQSACAHCKDGITPSGLVDTTVSDGLTWDLSELATPVRPDFGEYAIDGRAPPVTSEDQLEQSVLLVEPARRESVLEPGLALYDADQNESDFGHVLAASSPSLAKMAWTESRQDLVLQQEDKTSASKTLRSVVSNPMLSSGLPLNKADNNVGAALLTHTMQRAIGARREAPFHLPVAEHLPSPKLGAMNAFVAQQKRLSKRSSLRSLRSDTSSSPRVSQEFDGALGFASGGAESPAPRGRSPLFSASDSSESSPSEAVSRRPSLRQVLGLSRSPARPSASLHRSEHVSVIPVLISTSRSRPGSSGTDDTASTEPWNCATPRSRMSELAGSETLTTPPLSPRSPGLPAKRRSLLGSATSMLLQGKRRSGVYSSPSSDNSSLKTPPTPSASWQPRELDGKQQQRQHSDAPSAKHKTKPSLYI